MVPDPWYWAERFFIYGDEVLQADGIVVADGQSYVSCLSDMERSFVLFADIADGTFYTTRELAQDVLTRINAAADAAE